MCLAAFVLLFTNCEDDKPYYGDGYDSEFNILYSNKTVTQPATGDLTLNYSDCPVYGRDVYFEMTSASTAKLKFFAVFPSEKETLVENVPLTKISGGYSFSGQAQSTKGTTFSYAGSVGDKGLEVNLTNVKIPNYPFGEKGTFDVIDYFYSVDSEQDNSDPAYRVINNYYYNCLPHIFDWQFVDEYGTEQGLGFLQTILVDPILAKLLYLVLPEITFHPDGNITANYAGLKDDIDIMGLMAAPVTSDMRGDIQSSPLNLCYYFVEGSYMYIQPDIEMIIRAVNSNRTRAETEGDMSLTGILNMVLTLYPSVTKWANTGVKFNFIPNDSSTPAITTDITEFPNFTNVTNFYYYYGADYRLYADLEELQPVIDILPALLTILLSNVELPGSEELGGMDLLGLLDGIIGNFPNTTRFNLGLFLGNKDPDSIWDLKNNQ